MTKDVNDHLVIVDSFHITEEAADELADELSDPMGLVQDLTFGGSYMIVRWPDYE